MPKTNTSWEKAIRYISFRPRTEHEVRQHLGQDCTQALIDRLIELRFINDTEYVSQFIASHPQLGPRALMHRLHTHGINLKSISLPNEPDLALRVLSKKPVSWSRLKAYRFLLSRGFTISAIEKVLKIRYNSPDVTWFYFYLWPKFPIHGKTI